MNQTQSARQVAWGLDLGATRATLVRLEVHDGQAVVRQQQGFDLPPDWSKGQFGTALVAALTHLVPGEPLGICFPDQAMLCRGLSMPKAEPAIMAKMIAAQAEGFLSGGSGGSGGPGGSGGAAGNGGTNGLEWTSSSFADPTTPGAGAGASDPAKQWVLFCAARREMLDSIRRALPSGVELKALLPRALAAAHGAPTDGLAAPPRVLVDLSDQAMTMSLLMGQRVLRCLVLEGEDEALPHANGAAWVMQSRRGLDALLDGIPPTARPRTGILRTGNGDGEPLAAALSSALSLTVTPLPAPSTSAAVASAAGPSDAAVGAARLALRDAGESAINFAQLRKDKSADTAQRPLRIRRLLALAAVCVLAVASLYFIDRYRAHMLTVEVDSLRQAEKSSGGGVAQRLAVGQYLEKNASPALATLDAVLTAAPPSVGLTNFGITRSGSEGPNTAGMAGPSLAGGAGLHLVVTLGGQQEIGPFVDKLDKSKVLTHIQIISVRNNQGKWSLELTGDIAAAAGAPGMPATKPSAAPAATRPATTRAAAATRPAMTMPAQGVQTRSDPRIDAAATTKSSPAAEAGRRAQP